MKNEENRHLTPDEIAEIVFPAGDRPAPVPAHLAVCAPCRARVARLTEGWLEDRSDVDRAVEELPEAFWEGQRAAVLREIDRMPATGPLSAGAFRPFPAARTRAFFRHPVLALSGLAAALALVAVVSVHRAAVPAAGGSASSAMATPVVAAAPSGDQADDELLLSIDRILREEPAYTSLVPDETT
jgi:hypothetical protein